MNSLQPFNMNVSESDQCESITDCNAIFELVFIPVPIKGDPKEEQLHGGQSLPSILRSSECCISSYQVQDSKQEGAAYMGKRFIYTLIVYINLSPS